MTTRHLTVGGERRQCVPDRGGRLPSDAGVDLVEHQRGWTGVVPRPEQHEAQREHRSGQLAAGRHLRQRELRRSGIGGEQERDLVAGVGVADGHAHRRVGHRQRDEVCLYLLGHSWSGCSPRRRDLLGLGGDRRLGRRPLAIELGGAHVVRLELDEPLARLLGERHDLGQRLAVLAPQVGQQMPAVAHGRQPLGIVVDALPQRPQLGSGIAQLGGRGRAAVARSR